MIKNNKINKNRKSLFTERRGFTFIEILLIVSIIGILAVIILVFGTQTGKDRAAINSYKTTMNSVKTALELCGEGNIIIGGGISEGSNVCSTGYDKVRYPEMDARCGSGAFTFSAALDADGKWAVATNEDCEGCRIVCSVEGCRPWTGTESNCK